MSGVRCLLCTLPFATSRPTFRPNGSFDLHVSTTPPAFTLSQDQTLQLESLVTKHDSRECECASCLSTHHLAIPTAFLPGPPNLRPPCGRSIARTSARRLDTLPLCLGSDCLLVKERRRPHALENRDCSSGPGVVNTKPPRDFHFFRTPRHEPRTGSRMGLPPYPCK